jgi:hypothetical protein
VPEKVISIGPLQVSKAIARLPKQSNAAIQRVLENARRAERDDLISACQQELQRRGSLDLTDDAATHAARLNATVAGKNLQEVIEIAFRDVPAKPEEALIIRWIAQHCGASYRDLLTVYGKQDLSLVIGHLIYYRFGYFRDRLLGGTQSDLLLERDTSGESVRYTLRPEALAAFRSLGMLND